ncbi:MAG: F0F1 ATP synthase subunit epsilon [Proteobacteria bacterium]|nr:F0F1 ATP synthase subunit epsilon [Pseudomonadota bacterium]
MAKNIVLEIVTPDRKVLSEEVEYVEAPGALGEFGIMANHIPFLSALGIGNLYYKQNGKYFYVFVAGGFAEVSNNKMTVLAEVAETAAEIDLDRAAKAQDKAKARVAKAQENIEHARGTAALRRAISRISCQSAGKQAGTC